MSNTSSWRVASLSSIGILPRFLLGEQVSVFVAYPRRPQEPIAGGGWLARRGEFVVEKQIRIVPLQIPERHAGKRVIVQKVAQEIFEPFRALPLNLQK